MSTPTPDLHPDLAQRAAHTLRGLAMDAVQAANSGHPGAPMGMAEMAAALWGHALRYDPADPEWFDRDRFVLSNGHASALLYGLLHLTDHGLTLDDLKAFRQWGAPTAGHPERGEAILLQLAEEVQDLAIIESRPNLDGRNMIMMLAPLKDVAPKKEKAEDKAEDNAEAPAPEATAETS